MKNTIMIVLAFLVSSCFAQKVNVPQTVKNAFAEKFATATKVEWDVEDETEFEAEFKLNDAEMTAVYNAEGVLLEVETEMKEADLPQAIKTTMETDFAGFKFEEVEKVEANGEVKYEMEAEKGKEEYELVFDENGKLLTKEKEDESEENDKD